MTKLSFPFTEEKIRALKVGDEVLISGVVFTGRDAVHKYLHEGGKLPRKPDGSVDHFTMQAVSPLADFSFDYQDLWFTPLRTAEK